MLQIILEKTSLFLRAKNRWWIPILTGLLFSLSQPPFNHTFNPVFAFFPLLSFIVIVPLFVFATHHSIKRAMVDSALFGFFASVSQYYWIGFVTAEGLWHLILIGVVLIALYFGLYYFAAAMVFRFISKKLPRLYLQIFPAFWVCVDYIRTLGEVSFPWSFMGYSLVPFLPIAQMASVTGVWGITFLIVLMNCLIWDLLKSYRSSGDTLPRWLHVCVLFLFICGISIWGAVRMSGNTEGGKELKVSLIQSNLDQLNWGVNSLDTAFLITDSMITEASLQNPDLIIGPESALLCFLSRRAEYRNRVVSWVNSMRIPLLLGGLHWEKAPQSRIYDYFVYNSAFLFKPDTSFPLIYSKIKLVPFSEALPFEGVLPILSRVNLGEADFKQGSEQAVLQIKDSLRIAPFICYEIIYPGFVQQRIKKGVDCIVTITNDGWFGKTSGPFQHAAMAQMRAIENGRPLVRCANSGISMIVDLFGRVSSKTPIYVRQILTGSLKLDQKSTFYLQWGDWFVAACFGMCSVAMVFLIAPFLSNSVSFSRNRIKKKH
ncbi:MAG TPA: apolipoprotein N-acyltransferase [Chitinispirillaceae bacterium]|nr:apolipoprotein N-acyltransferase [Chitinispirillaceae bacterium]